MSSKTPDLDDDATGRIRIAGERGDVVALAEEIGALRKSVSILVSIEQQRRGATWALRGIAAIAITIAGAMGARALSLAGEAAVDHERLNSTIAQVNEHSERISTVQSAIAVVERDAAVSTATLGELRAAVLDLRDEVRAMRREAAERDRRR